MWFWSVDAVDTNFSDGSAVDRAVRRFAVDGYCWELFWYCALAFRMAVLRLDCAARSFADFVTPRKVGMAMASRMARINSTTMSSMRVKPASAPASPVASRLSFRRRIADE